ncbi:MAG TPA: hypothetical protein VJ720_15880 [Chitinophaga sp.]|nr:hypothetical protein [Chitinophaga sp.]
MATQNSIISFTGRLGNMIGYRRNGKLCLRSRPITVGQTMRTKRASQRFGMASKNAAFIRKPFYGYLDIRPDGRHCNRLTTALIPSGGIDISSITGFRFNQETGTDRFFAQPPRLSADGILHIPPQTLPAFKDITALEVKMIAIRINFTTQQVVGTESATLIIDASEPFNGAAVTVDVPGTGTLIVTLQVRGMKNNIPSGNRKYFAADIIAVQPSQALEVLHKQSYFQQRPKKISGSTYTHPHIIQRE